MAITLAKRSDTVTVSLVKTVIHPLNVFGMDATTVLRQNNPNTLAAYFHFTK